MYKDIKNGVENEDKEKDEKVIIRLKRKIEETTIPSIYVKKSNKRICNGLFYKHIDTILPEEVDSNKKYIDCINLSLKHEKLNCDTDLLFLEKKRKFASLKSYEKDLKGAINNLKKYKIINQNIQYVALEGERKRKFKIIDIDLNKNIKNNENIELEKRREEEYRKEQDYEYDLYILDNEKLQLEKYMDYLYDIKNNNIDTSSVVVLEDIYGNNTNEYETDSYTSSLDSTSEKEISDYPDESSNNINDESIFSDYFHESNYSDDYDKDANSNNHDNDIYNDECDQNIYSDNFDKNISSDSCHRCEQRGVFKSFEDYAYEENSLENNSYKNNLKDKNQNKIKAYNKKMDSLSFEEKINDELQKRLKKKNEDSTNATLSDKLKILEQMENEYYNK